MSKKSKVVAGIVGAGALALAAAVPAAAYPTGAGNGVIQQVPVPDSGSCADYMSPDSLNWSGVGAGAWNLTFDGQCTRTFWYDNGGAVWYVR